MALFLTLADYDDGVVRIETGSLISDAVFDLPRLQSAGLAALLFTPAMQAPLDAYRSQRPIADKRETLVALLLASGLFGGGTDVPSSRQLIAGLGLTGGGDLSANRTFDVGPAADGSIVVFADEVAVGVLATDAQHGNRGGGALHAAATPATAGFMSAADKTKLDATAVVSNANPTTIQPDDAASPGVSPDASRADHRHAIVADVAVDTGSANAEGVSTSFSRAEQTV